MKYFLKQLSFSLSLLSLLSLSTLSQVSLSLILSLSSHNVRLCRVLLTLTVPNCSLRHTSLSLSLSLRFSLFITSRPPITVSARYTISTLSRYGLFHYISFILPFSYYFHIAFMWTSLHYTHFRRAIWTKHTGLSRRLYVPYIVCRWLSPVSLSLTSPIRPLRHHTTPPFQTSYSYLYTII